MVLSHVKIRFETGNVHACSAHTPAPSHTPGPVLFLQWDSEMISNQVLHVQSFEKLPDLCIDP